jgi:hypothetical protein
MMMLGMLLGLTKAAVFVPAMTASMTPVPLSRVRLLPGSVGGSASFEHSARALNSEYLRWIDPDRLLIGYRQLAGLSPAKNATSYGGWCSGGGCEWVGHYLSALAFATASGDEELRAKGAYVVGVLAKAQAAIGKNDPSDAGWLGLFEWDDTLRDANKTHGTSAGFYGTHKMLAGLCDQWQQCGNHQAREMAISLADFLYSRLHPLIQQRGWSWWSFLFLNPGNAGHGYDIGGIMEALYNVYAISRQPHHATLASYFSNPWFFDPLLNGTDSLHNEHANAHIPVAVGVARGAELTQNATLATLAQRFWERLNSTYTFSTGGSSVNEYWKFPGQHGDAIKTAFNESTGSPMPMDSNGFHTQEMCTNYNTLKLTRHLLQWSAHAALGDSYERLFINGVLGVQKPGHMGVMSYLTPLGNGVTRSKFDWWGWGAPDNAFWCCYGTTIETFAKVGDTVWFQDRGSGSSGGDVMGSGRHHRLTVVQYISSTVRWQLEQPSASAALRKPQGPAVGGGAETAAGSRNVTMHAEMSADATALSVNISIAAPATGAGAPGRNLTVPHILRLRLPGWAILEQTSITYTISGSVGAVVPVPLPAHHDGPSWVEIALNNITSPGGSLNRAAVVVHALFGMGAWVSMINDNRPQYESMATIMWGPLVLAGLTERNNSLCVDAAKVKEWLTPDNEAIAISSSVAAASSPRYLWRLGALAHGDDLGARNVSTLAQAEAHCDKLGSKCTGFTYAGPRTLPSTSPPLHVLFKADTAANRSGWDLDKTWSSWLKVEQEPIPVGRVLQFTAKGQDGHSFTFRPLNRMVDESYAVYFNLTNRACTS